MKCYATPINFRREESGWSLGMGLVIQVTALALLLATGGGSDMSLHNRYLISCRHASLRNVRTIYGSIKWQKLGAT